MNFESRKDSLEEMIRPDCYCKSSWTHPPLHDNTEQNCSNDTSLMFTIFGSEAVNMDVNIGVCKVRERGCQTGKCDNKKKLFFRPFFKPICAEILNLLIEKSISLQSLTNRLKMHVNSLGGG